VPNGRLGLRSEHGQSPEVNVGRATVRDVFSLVFGSGSKSATALDARASGRLFCGL